MFENYSHINLFHSACFNTKNVSVFSATADARRHRIFHIVLQQQWWLRKSVIYKLCFISTGVIANYMQRQ